MAILIWDLPPPEQMAAYNEKARTDWIPTVVCQPAVKEFRALRNALHASPQAMRITQYDSLAAALTFIETGDFARVREGLRAAGCTNITVPLWDASPVVPEPIRLGSSTIGPGRGRRGIAPLRPRSNHKEVRHATTPQHR